jgi:metal-dependent amidase/aminoacylase/carboxypeptidase family protein
VITVGTFHAGTTYNVIPGAAVLEGTLRTLNKAVRAQALQSICDTSASVAKSYGATATTVYDESNPPLVNSKSALPLASQAAHQVVGSSNTLPLETANMGAEDFAHYLDHVPGCYVRYGARPEGQEDMSPHGPRWDFNEKTLLVGAKYLAAVAVAASQALAPQQQQQQALQ